MTYKEKHLKKAFGPILLSALMILPTGCGKINKSYDSAEDSGGLLDPTPIEQNDEYGKKVKLSHVQIPVYNQDGDRLPNQWVLTRGIAETNYIPDMSKISLSEVSINNNPHTSYVRVDANEAVLTDDNKGCGLFVKYSKIVVVGNESLDDYIGKRRAKYSQNSEKTAKTKTVQAKDTATVTAPAEMIEIETEIKPDSITNQADTLKNLNISVIKPDSISRND